MATVLAPAVRERRFAGTRGLAVNGGALVVNVLASGVTGLVFWVLAARTAPPAVVAQASAAIAAVIAVVSLTQQSLVFTLPSLLAASPEPKRLARNAYAAAIGLTAIVAPAYVVVGPKLAGGLEFLQSWHLAGAFLVGTLVWCLFSLQDAVLTGIRKAKVVLVENTAWGLLRLAIVLGAWSLGVHLGVGWLLASWIIPALALVVGVTWYLFRGPALAAPLGTQAFARRRLLSFLGAEYVASILSSIVTLVCGAYALTTFGAEAAAPFFTAASLVIVVEGALASFAQALAVEACRADGAHRGNLLRLTGLLLGGLSFGAVAVTAVAGHQIMSMLGASYAGPGGTALAILMCGVPARSLSLVSNADNRLRGDGGRNLLQQVVACVVLFGLLLSGIVDTVPALAWAVVAMRVVPALLAGAHLRRGALRLAT